MTNLHDLRISLEPCASEGALPRVIGLIERRGFGVVAMYATPTLWGESRGLSVCIDAAQRDPNGLVRQLDKLFEVRNVRLVERTVSNAV